MATSNVLIQAKKKKAFRLIEQGNFEAARRSYIEITLQQQRDTESWRLLGAVNGQLGLYDESIAALERALAIDRDDAEAWFNLGQAHNHIGNRERAAAAYREVIRLMPGHSDAHNNLGYVLKWLGDGHAAIACYREALRAQPDNADALANMGEAMMDFGAHADAMDCFRRAIIVRPEFINAYLSKGYAHYTQGDAAGALECFERVLALQPGNQDAIVGMATLYEKTGDFQRAYELLNPLIELEAGGWRFALAAAQVLRHFGRREEAVRVLQRELEQGNASHGNSALLNFELGKLFDGMSEYDRAFRHYSQANALKRNSRGDPHEFIRLMDAMMDVFTPEFLRNAPRAVNDSERPLFIVGMPRSGTTLVEQILASHPAIHGGGELPFINQIALALPQSLPGAPVAYPECLRVITGESLNRAAQRYLGQLQALSRDAARVSDKMPHNFQHLGLIQLLFPRARIVHCTRNPLDTCFSIFTYAFNEVHTYATDLERLGEHYRKYRQLMRHWQQNLNISMLEISYENLVLNQEEQSRKLIEFCDLPWDERCLRFYENDRIVNTISYDQVRRPIYNKSVERWRHYEQYLAPLQAALNDDPPALN